MGASRIQMPSYSGTTRAVRDNWLLWAAGLLLAGLVAGLYWKIVPEMVGFWWQDEGYTHGFLVVPLAVYLAWKQKISLLPDQAVPDLRGLSLTLGACAAYLVGNLGAEYFLSRASLVLLLAGLGWTFLGLAQLRALVLPLLLVLSAVPLPVIIYNRLAGPLQLLASAISTAVVQLVGVSVYRDGNVIHLATTSLGVAEACSGLRSMSSLTVAALLLGYLECSRLRTRAVLVVFAIPVSVLFNVLRVAGTALLAERNPEFAEGFYHSFSGWVVFVGGFGTLYLLMLLLRRILDPSPRERVS